MTLVTCFGPFGDVAHNTTIDATGGLCLRTSIASMPPLDGPILATGLAVKRTEICVERVAINVMDFRIPDVDGNQPRGVPVIEGGPDAYLTEVDVRAMADAIGGVVSNTAGTYVCNALYYKLLHHLRPRGIPVVFVHLPPVDAVPLERQQEAVRCAVDFISRS